ncbi:MAG: NAD(P)-dependent oxidoreductase [Planctomycetota bacterium]|nr:NAD(P)-dependent oxidoreductase [Planctomycetota bacterium]
MPPSNKTSAFELSPNTRVGWIGAGVMGLPMCGHILKSGRTITLYNRTRAKAEPLLEAGATWADSPRAVAEASDVVITIVGYPDDVRAVYLGEAGVLAGAKSGAIVIDMTTTRPSLAREIFQAARKRGVGSVDAPVSGGDVGAKSATLSIMVGGEKKTVDAVLPLLRILGKSIVYQGEAGAGQHAKMCNQIAIAGTMVGVCESLLYGYKSGLNLETLLESIRGGAAGCWTLDNLAPRVIKRNFDPGFFVEHFIKDMRIALEEAERMGIALPGLALAHQLYLAVRAQGHGKCGTHALMLALEQLSNIDHGR